MKTIITLAISLLLVGCAIPSNPKVSFGKKCHVVDENITYSYVWLFDKKTGLEATEAQCVHLTKK
tara:strand:- start:946 stop:1140 length:195 start_codon:yes stop_codon:yes gene_type:complete